MLDSTLLDSTNHVYWYWNFNRPTLSGNSYGWKSCWVNLAPLGYFHNVHDGDTILYRFTFISDSVQTNKDGLMFDNLNFEDQAEGIYEIQNNNLISVSPNPFSTQTTLHTNEDLNNATLTVYNSLGQQVKQLTNISGHTVTLYRDNLPSGLYFIRLADDNKIYTDKLVITDN